MLKKILTTIDRSFDEGNYENFRLNEGLLVINTFLLFITAIVLMEDAGWITIHAETRHVIHILEIAFGIVFLAEFILRLIYAYIPDRTLFTLYPLIQVLVILSLLAPTLINVAFLRIIVSLKMLKIYHMRRENMRKVACNPDFVARATLIEKAAQPLEHAVEHVGGAATRIATTIAKRPTKS